MAATPANAIELDPKLLERARKAADERGVAVPQLVNTALEHELGDEAPQPPFSLIGAFKAGRSDLSARASRDEFEPRPFRFLAVTERLAEPKLATLDHRHFGTMRPRHMEALELLPAVSSNPS